MTEKDEERVKELIANRKPLCPPKIRKRINPDAREYSAIKPNQPTPPKLAVKLTYKIKCPWCGAEPNKPCVDENGKMHPFGFLHKNRYVGWH